MKTVIKICLLIIFLGFSTTSRAQVLISLLFGDALNTDKIEFGLIGGLNRSYIRSIDESSGLNNFNLGFFFHINMFESSYLSTGVLVKSNVGAKGMSTYPVGDPEFDDVYAEGELTKEIGYFYVPVMWHQRFNNRFYLEGGLQIGLRSKVRDFFILKDSYGGDLEYRRDVKDEIKALDAGLVAGMGYKFKKEIKSLAVGVNYYYGLTDCSKVDDMVIKNSSVYIYMKIPIGTHPKEKKDKKSKAE